MRRILIIVALAGLAAGEARSQATNVPQPRHGVMVDLGGHRLHVDCRGTGSPTVVIENGFDEFSFDWELVQTALARTNRVCTYDRAGYAWSDVGPKPRTFSQINLELHDALLKLGERGPYILVGHQFGAPLVRQYAAAYPKEVSGLVLVDGMSEEQRFEMWHKAILMRDGAKGKPIPEAREAMVPADKIEVASYFRPTTSTKVDAPFDRLPSDIQSLHLWAQSQRSLAAAEENEREWSPEYFAQWHSSPSSCNLGSIPLIVVSRAKGQFHDLDIPAIQQESERKQSQENLASLSSQGEQLIVPANEDTAIEKPLAVVEAVRTLCDRGSVLLSRTDDY